MSRAADTAVLTAHHTRNRQGALMVSDDQRIAPQCYFLPVEQYDLFLLLCHPHPDSAIDFG